MQVKRKIWHRFVQVLRPACMSDIYIYICVCVCVHIYIYIYIHTHTHIHIHTYIHTYINVIRKSACVQIMSWISGTRPERCTCLYSCHMHMEEYVCIHSNGRTWVDHQVDLLKNHLKDSELRATESREDALRSKRALEDFVTASAERQMRKAQEDDKMFQVLAEFGLQCVCLTGRVLSVFSNMLKSKGFEGFFKCVLIFRWVFEKGTCVVSELQTMFCARIRCKMFCFCVQNNIIELLNDT